MIAVKKSFPAHGSVPHASHSEPGAKRIAEYRATGTSGVVFHPTQIGVLFTAQGPHRVQVLDVRGKVWTSEVGCGHQEHFFERSRFGRGIFFVRATTEAGSQLKRYFLDK